MRGVAALTIAAAVSFAVSGCSPGLDYPSLFPAVHDMPPPRPETTMDADQVQRATETLISERDHLSAQAQGAGQDKQDKTGAGAANAAKKPVAAKPPAAAPAAPAGASAQSSAPAATQTAGAEAKP